VLAHYWKFKTHFQQGQPPARVSDFLFDLPPQQVQRIKSDSQGRFLLEDGTAIDVSGLPALTGLEVWQMETVVIDRRAIIIEAVEAFWHDAEANDYPSDHSNRQIQRSGRDPKGITTEASNLVGDKRLF